MRWLTWLASAFVVFAGWLVESPVRANPEAPALSDGRSVAMAGVGAAASGYASTVWQNPATIGTIKQLTITATILPLMRKIDAPFPDPTTGAPREVEGKWQPGALGALAVGYRLHERVALGLASYVFSGNAIEYPGVVAGQDVMARAFAMEIQLPVAVALTDALSLAAAYRVTYSSVDTQLPVPTGASPTTFARTDTNLVGWNFAGFAFGVLYRFNDAIRAGLSYRTEVLVDLDGDTETTMDGQSSTIDARGEYALPHTFKLGGEFHLQRYHTLLALDLTYWLYGASHPRDLAAGRPADYQDAFRASLGVEYRPSDLLALRGGFYMGNSATTAASATQLAVTPGILYGFSLGVGLALSRKFALDLALAFSTAPGSTVSTADNTTAPGHYEARTFIGCASLNYTL